MFSTRGGGGRRRKEEEGIIPDEEDEAEASYFIQPKYPERLDCLLLPEAPDDLPDSQGQHNTQPELLRHPTVHITQACGARGPPLVKRPARGEEGVDEQGGEEGTDDVAVQNGYDGCSIVAAGGAGHDNVGGDGGGDAGRGEHADDDGDGGRPALEGAGREGDVKDG